MNAADHGGGWTHDLLVSLQPDGASNWATEAGRSDYNKTPLRPLFQCIVYMFTIAERFRLIRVLFLVMLTKKKKQKKNKKQKKTHTHNNNNNNNGLRDEPARPK